MLQFFNMIFHFHNTYWFLHHCDAMHRVVMRSTQHHVCKSPIKSICERKLRYGRVSIMLFHLNSAWTYTKPVIILNEFNYDISKT